MEQGKLETLPESPRRERPRTGRIERRSIEVSDYSGIDPIRVTRIIDDCASYSDRRPYGWFNVLNDVLSAAVGVSYDGLGMDPERFGGFGQRERTASSLCSTD